MCLGVKGVAMGSDPILSCGRCGPYVWHEKPEDCPSFGLGVLVPLKLSAKPGRPALSEPRSHVAATRITQAEYDGLIQLLAKPTDSISDLVRELLSEAVMARMAKRSRAERPNNR